MKVKWWREPENFGDVLTPYVLKHFGISFEYVDDVENADALCIGSIARLALPGQMVLGSGRIRKEEITYPEVDWKFVRGPLTRDNVIENGGSCPEIYGDPALLLPEFCAASSTKHDVGIVPHYQDYAMIKRQYPQYHVINVVNEKPLVVAREISKCDKIISSSLHGIIAAHAYGIPAAWVTWSKLHGDKTKFYDYFLSVGIKDPVESSMSRVKFIDPGQLSLDPIKEVFEELANGL